MKYSVVLALGAILDPHIKLSLLEYCYSKVDASTSESKLEKVKKKKKNKLYNLFEHYSSRSKILRPPKSHLFSTL